MTRSLERLKKTKGSLYLHMKWALSGTDPPYLRAQKARMQKKFLTSIMAAVWPERNENRRAHQPAGNK